MLQCPAPQIVSFDEQEVVERAAVILADGRITRRRGADGLWVRVPFTMLDLTDKTGFADLGRAQAEAMAIFQYVLGAIRAHVARFGILKGEWEDRYGYGEFVDEEMNQKVLPSPPVVDIYYLDEAWLQQRLYATSNAVVKSENLKNAVTLHGRSSRTCADAYMIYEYAEREFGRNQSAIVKALQMPDQTIREFKESACNMAPLLGGRHAYQKSPSKVTIDLLGVLETADWILRRWIEVLE